MREVEIEYRIQKSTYVYVSICRYTNGEHSSSIVGNWSHHVDQFTAGCTLGFINDQLINSTRKRLQGTFTAGFSSKKDYEWILKKLERVKDNKLNYELHTRTITERDR